MYNPRLQEGLRLTDVGLSADVSFVGPGLCKPSQFAAKDHCAISNGQVPSGGQLPSGGLYSKARTIS